MAYANVFCAVSVQVQFTINTNQGQFIYGSIAATQFLGNGQAPVIKLFYADSDHPARVEVGSPIELDRKVVATPTSGGVLGIAYDLYDSANGRLIAKNEVPFCIMRDGGYVTAPKNLTYTQEADDGLVSISVTLIPFPDVHPED